MSDLNYIFTAVSFMVCAILFLGNIKKVKRSDKYPELQKKQRVCILKTCSILLFIISGCCTMFYFDSRNNYEWEDVGNGNYSVFKNKTLINAIQVDDSIFTNYENFFLSQKSNFGKQSYSFSIKEVDKTHIKEINKYLHSLIKVVPKVNGTYVILIVEKNRNYVFQKEFLIQFYFNNSKFESEILPQFINAELES